MATALVPVHRDHPVQAGPPPTRLVGIARLAAESPKTRERASIEYFALESRSALNRESSGRMPFDWTLNPYRGCEFGCKYCYARYTHEFMEMWDGADFERKIFAKINAPVLLRAEIARARDRGQSIALGTATDPYQPAEKQFEITRRMLEVFASFEGLEFSITTKSVLILRDLDLLKQIANRQHFGVHMTVTTTDERLARLLEPKAPPPGKRLEAVSRLAEAGIRVSVNAMPILPGITDDPLALDELARQAAVAGARSLHGNVLFLMPSAMRYFMPFLESEFPKLVKRYRRLYARSAYLRGPYKEQISRLMGDLRAKYGLVARGEEKPRTAPQLSLPWGESGSRRP
jgi:DNA repair photolyase